MAHHAIWLPIFGLALLSNRPLPAQQPAPAPSDSKVFTVDASTRLVVEDVLVTDHDGRPVNNLPQAAFHVMDNGADQKIVNFDQASATGPTAGPRKEPVGHFSNEAFARPSGQIVAMLLDPVGMEIPDQMYLRVQMLATLRTLPPAVQVAIFRSNGGSQPLLVQSLTTDRALLEKAIKGSVPRFTRPVSTPYSNALSEIEGIAQYLGQAPGPKQLLWFAGSFPLFSSPAGQAVASQGVQQEEDLKVAYRLLQRARVQVFPIDVRGVRSVGLGAAISAAAQGPSAQPDQKQVVLQGDGAQQFGEWSSMDSIASETGGKAFYSSNSISAMVSRAIDLGNHSYSLGFHPSDSVDAGLWHTVRLKVDGPYNLSYRRGYFAVSQGEADKPTDRLPGSSRSKELANGPAKDQPALPDLPIVFDAKVSSSSETGQHGSILVTVRYGITARDLLFNRTTDGHQQADLKIAAIAYNGDGEILSNSVDTMKTNFSSDQLQLAQRVGVPMSQTIEVAKKASYLLLAVVDQNTGRTGTVQLTMDTAKSLAQ